MSDLNFRIEDYFKRKYVQYTEEYKLLRQDMYDLLEQEDWESVQTTLNRIGLVKTWLKEIEAVL